MAQQPGLVARLTALAQKYLNGGTGGGGPVQAYQPTGQPYIPSHVVAPADGSRYGSTQASLEMLRQAEEFAVACKRLAEAVSAATWQVLDTADQPVRKNHPAVQLIQHPNGLMDWSFFAESMVFNLLPTGNAYAVLQRSMAGNVLSMWPLRADRTRPIRGNDPMSPVQGYEHYAEDGTRYVFAPEDVLHIKQANPFSPYTGLGASQLIPTTMGMDRDSLTFNQKFFSQGGRLSTIIEVEKKMDPGAWKDMQAKLAEAYMGTQNAHRILVLDDNAKMNTNAANASPKEADFIQTRKDISRTTGALLGVPPIYMGHMADANLANSYVQDKIFFQQGVRPLMVKLAEALTQVVASYGQLRFDFKAAEVRDPATSSAQATAGFNTGALSPNDARELLGLDRIKGDPDMDKRFVPVSAVPLADAAAPLDMAPEAGLPKPAAVAPAAGSPQAAPQAAAGGLQAVPELKVAPSAAEDQAVARAWGRKAAEADKVPNKGTATQRRVLRYAIQQRPRTERRYKKAVRRWLLAVGEQAAQAVEAQAKTWNGRAFGRTALLEAVAKALEPSPTDLQAGVMPVVEAELLAYYADLSGLFGLDGGSFQPGAGSFAAATTQLATRVTRVSQAVQADIDAIIRKGMELGLSPYEIANGTADGSFDGIRGTFEEFSQERAQLIARTETCALQDQAAIAAYKDMGVQTLDVLGCEDFEVMPGQVYGCNSKGIPVAVASGVEFHPNHRGALVPGEAEPLAPKALAALARPFHVER